MSDYVVTISRQFASMGRTIGLKMAENLGIELYDRDIVKEVINMAKKLTEKALVKKLDTMSREELA